MDKIVSNKWLKQANLLLETEGFMIAIQDQVIRTRNYCKFIKLSKTTLKTCAKDVINDARETIQRITRGCRIP